MRLVLVFLAIITFCFALGSMFLSLLAATGTVDVTPEPAVSAEGSPTTTGYVSIDVRPSQAAAPVNASEHPQS
ncbi:MAG: hypothetical protein ACLFO2_03875 [Candidatus Woesearchaeota archaeon]